MHAAYVTVRSRVIISEPLDIPLTFVAMQFSIFCLTVAAIFGGALGFRVAPRGSLTASLSQLQRRTSPFALAGSPRTASASGRSRQWIDITMQLGDKDRGVMPSYEEEQEKEFFKTDLDKASTAQKVKDPVVLITLGWIVGMFVLATALVLNGGY